ncbi:MAG: hypothetical protein WKG32_16215 [Gemmatimonadaceae bacterium]
MLAAVGALALFSAVACARTGGGERQPGRDAQTAAPPTPALIAQASGTTSLLQAVSVVNASVVWVSGHKGTYARTTDGGAIWQAAVVPGADTLQFRDVHAVSATTAYLMSAGSGDLSRIYRTDDAGRTWALQFTNRDPKAFYDCMDFWDARRGVAYSDAVDGRTVIITTADGGAHWEPVPAAGLPAALAGEGGFAASGTCLVTREGGRAWIGTGSGPAARVLLTTDYGRTWAVAATPIPGGEASGIMSVAFRDATHGVIVGGQLTKPTDHSDNVAVSADGGRSWTLAGRPRLAGPVFGGVYVPGAASPTIVAAGPKGLDLSRDDAATWTALDTLAYWSVGFANPGAGWAVGPGGRITKIKLF